jgi:hypothetical protein
MHTGLGPRSASLTSAAAALLIVLFALIGTSSCQVQEVAGFPFACSSALDCAPGFPCIDGRCVAVEVDAGRGPCEAVGPELCTGAEDEDCNALVDCQDPVCFDRSCGGPGATCSGGICRCSGNGGPVELEEASCADNADNDCDALTDCEDPSCNGQGCGSSGMACTHGACLCSGNGGQAQPAGQRLRRAGGLPGPQLRDRGLRGARPAVQRRTVRLLRKRGDGAAG